jgi:hypothetical protein
VTARGEFGALAVAVTLAGVVFAVQSASHAPSTVRGLTGTQRPALAAAAAPASESAPVRRAAPVPALGRLRPAAVQSPAAVKSPIRAERAPTQGSTPRVHKRARVRRAVAPRVVIPVRATPRVPSPRLAPVVVRPLPRRIPPRVAPQPAPKPAPNPAPKPRPPAGESFVSSG